MSRVTGRRGSSEDPMGPLIMPNGVVICPRCESGDPQCPYHPPMESPSVGLPQMIKSVWGSRKHR